MGGGNHKTCSNPESMGLFPEDPTGQRVRVQTLLPVPGPYDYRLPAEWAEAVQEGSILSVPVGGRQLLGVVRTVFSGQEAEETDASDVSDATAPPWDRLKPIEALADSPPLPADILPFVDWVAAYTVSLPGSVLRLALSCPAALRPPAGRPGYRLAAEPDIAADPGLRLTPARRRILDVLGGLGGVALAAEDLAREAGVGRETVRAAARAGLLEPVVLAGEEGAPRFSQGQGVSEPPALSPEQNVAADQLVAKVGAGFSVTLLEGVTGSGKTEVYLQAVRAALADGKRALVLLPEIALSEAILSRVTGQLGASVALWHSGMGQADRRRTWRAIARGKVSVVVGARSALFLPMADLGLIVVDEEHDAAFKQDEGVAYHGRDMAVVRGQLGGFPVLLASATPSLETLENVRSGRYDRVRLARRHGGAQLPEIALVDITETPPDRWALPGDAEGPARRMGWLTPPVIAAVEQCLAEGDQALLFLNRRGYAPLTLCRVCGYRIRCPSCTAWLVEHRRVGRLVCHHCGHTERLPQNCPSCGHEGSLAPCGPGVERLAEEAQVRFPEAQMVVAASDTMGGPKAAAEVADRIRAREVNLIIGTQVMAKGHHFAHLTMVGVVDGDLGLAGGDPRAAERTHQLLHQVAGRAGRAERPGRVLIQTADPGMPVMEALASGDSESFFAAEAEERQAFSLPPYGRLASILISGPKEDQVEETARRLGLSAPKDPRVTVLGPSPPPLAVRAGRHRRRILVASPKALRLQPLLRHWLGLVQPPSSVTVRVDVDPVSFL